MNKKMSKRQRDLKTKLMAAICMLLVSSIMMVSTTYAWFTLSTAPEVTGITTAVGANGNLEMALMPENAFTAGADFGITSGTGDSMDVKAKAEANITWGNLVDLDDASYGMEQIMLYPAALNAEAKDTNGNPTTLGAAFLSTPAYGADGRVSGLLQNTTTGTLEGTQFYPSTNLGVRAVGAASGMTARQHTYRNAQSLASSSASQAKTAATASLNTKGSALASVAIKHGTSAGGEVYSSADVAAIRNIINDLLGTNDSTGILENIEKAYMQYILAYVASDKGPADDTVVEGFEAEVNKDGATLSSVLSALTTAGVTLDESITTMANALSATKTKVEEASAALETAEAKTGDIKWDDISAALNKLVDTGALEVNGFAVSTIKSNISAFATAVMNQGGVQVTMKTGGGVYADIADHCGDYGAAIMIDEISYGEYHFKDMKARMQTASTVAPPNLTVLGTVVSAAGAPKSPEGGDSDVPITDMYGYVIDLAFRTNASESNLKLQTEAADRIYGTDGSEATLGHGSTMTFSATTPEFTETQVTELMSAIRIVFFNPADRAIYATAKLDMDDKSIGADGVSVTAPIKLYEVTAGGQTETTYEAVAEGQTGGYYYDATAGEYKPADADHPGTHNAVTNTTTAGENWLEANNAVITALNQNQAHAVSALVYLDGEHIGNDDVAATAATSATGTMNLQFSSSATLVPMEYTALQKQDVSDNDTDTPAATTYAVTIDGTASTAATANAAYTFTLADGKSVASIKVGETDLSADTDYTVSGQSVTIKAEKVTGAIVITTA